MDAAGQILVLHGPNLNLLGLRETQHYGSTTLEDINLSLQKQAQDQQNSCTFFQSNSEEALINRIHQAAQEAVSFILFNPAAFTHSSIALRDALTAVNIPFIEIHLSNIYRRDAFRHRSYFSEVAIGTISGLGVQSYSLALSYALTHIKAITHTSSHS